MGKGSSLLFESEPSGTLCSLGSDSNIISAQGMSSSRLSSERITRAALTDGRSRASNGGLRASPTGFLALVLLSGFVLSLAFEVKTFPFYLFVRSDESAKQIFQVPPLRGGESSKILCIEALATKFANRLITVRVIYGLQS